MNTRPRPYYAPRPGWRDRYRNVWAGFLELVTFLFLIVAFLGLIVLTAASMDLL